ncbi:MAG: putative bifunctional diguanylate cyclase/phosphodiesterase [Methylovirgula sp.]
MAAPQTLSDRDPANARDAASQDATLDPRSILSSIGEVVYDWDLVSDQLIFGPNVADVLNFPGFAAATTGRAFAEYLSSASPSSRYEAIMDGHEPDIGRGVSYRVVYGLVDRPPQSGGRGTLIWIEDNGRWFAGTDGRPAHAHGTVRVITDRYEAERQLAQQSHCDPLTGALNRNHFKDQVDALLAKTHRKGSSFAILLVGVDNLAGLNRSYGYDIGDEVIAAAVGRLKAHIRATDVVARYAGNKFALLLEECTAEQMEIAAQRFLEAILNEPLQTAAGRIAASVRIGGVVAPQHGRTVQALFYHAEEALEAARRFSHDRFVAYTESLVRHDARLQIQNVSDSILAALNQSRIVLVLQPIIAVETGETAFHEALMRVVQEDGTLILPADVLPVAEKTGLVQLIDHRVLELAVQELAKDPNLRLAINASGATVLDIHWPDRLRAACAYRNGVAERLTIEITETCAIADLEAIRHAIVAMKDCGVKVAMDDFGSGHTSFRNLRNLRFDLLKIDGAFIQNLARSEDDRFFVRTLVELARHLGIPMVAEWVEDAESVALLKDWGVDYLQGHYFSPAQTILPKSELPNTDGAQAEALMPPLRNVVG